MMVKYVLPAAAVVLLVFGYVHVMRSQPSEDKLPPPAPPPRSPFQHAVAASGLVEARGENIAIGSAIPGIVQEVHVTSADVGKFVKKGTPLFRVDDRHLQAQLQLQERNLSLALAQDAKLAAMPRLEEIPAARARVKAMATEEQMRKDLAQRAQTLFERKAGSEEDCIQKQLALTAARFRHEQAQADLDLLLAGAWEADREVSRAGVELAMVQIELTRTEIARATVLAPIDGTVLQVHVRAGESVGTQPGQALMMMGDLSRFHVRVDIDEHDIARFRQGAAARAFVRGHARQEIKLAFVRVEPCVIPKKSLTGDNTERTDTRVLQAIYDIEMTNQTFYIGQQLDVFIDAGNG